MAPANHEIKCATCRAAGGYPGICPDCGLLYGLYERGPRTELQILRYPALVPK